MHRRYRALNYIQIFSTEQHIFSQRDIDDFSKKELLCNRNFSVSRKSPWVLAINQRWGLHAIVQFNTLETFKNGLKNQRVARKNVKSFSF